MAAASSRSADRRHRDRRRDPFRTLYKISEIYDRIAFAGVGKYNEFEMLRVAGCARPTSRATPSPRRRERPLPRQRYGQTLGQVFTHEMKPYEVEILVAEVADARTRTSCSTSSTTAP